MSAGLLRIAVVAGISAAVLAGCGDDRVKGSPAKSAESSKPPSVDLATLDTGKYSTMPRRLGQVASENEGRLAEAIRMDEAVADLANADPTLLYHNMSDPLVSPSDVAESVSFTGEAIVEPVLAKYGMICGQLVITNDAYVDFSEPKRPETDFKSVFLTLLRFPNEASARNAAVEMDAVDFDVSRENVSVPISKYPKAHGHWRPNHPSMAATLAHGDFVIHVFARNPTPNLETLTGIVEKTFDEEIAALDRFEPTPADQIGKLRRDTDGLLGRLIDFTPGTEPSLSHSFASFGPNAAEMYQSERQYKDRLFERAGVDRLAIWVVPKQGVAQIFRARDHDAAIKLMNEPGDDADHPIDGVRGLPDAKCFEVKQDIYKDKPSIRFACTLTYDRYFAEVTSADEADVRQRAAAQYVLLVHSL